MNPRKPLSFRQFFAQGFGLAKTGFASTRKSLQDQSADVCLPSGRVPDCCPFPSNWLSPAGAGPFFCAQSPLRPTRVRASAADARAFADALDHTNFAFAWPRQALASSDITTADRGDISCGKSLHFFSSQPLLRVACRTPARGLRPVRSPVRSWPMPRMATSSTVRSSAALRARRLAPFRARSAARDLTASAELLSTKPAIQGGIPLGWLFHFSPARAALT